MKSKHQIRNWSLALLVNSLFAAQYPAYKVASDAMGIGALNFWCFVIAIIALLPFLIRERQRTRSTRKDRFRWREFVAIGILGVVPASVMLSWGIAHSTAANGSILALTIPILMVLMGITLLGERPAPLYLVSLALALAGTALISWDDMVRGSFGGSMLLGNGAIFLGGAGSAFYNAYSKKLMVRATELEILVSAYVVAVACCGVASLLMDRKPFYAITAWPLSAWVGVGVLGAMSWSIAMVIWMWLLKRMTLAQISVTVYLLPVLALCLSVVTLGEHVTIMQGVGGVVVLASAYFSSGQPRGVES